MSLARLSLILIVIAVACRPAAGQSPGDTVLAKWGDISEEPSVTGKEVAELNWGDTLRVVRRKKVADDEIYLRVSRNGKEGWLSKDLVMSSEQRQEYKQALSTPGRLKTTRRGAMRKAPFSFGDRIATLVKGDTVRVELTENGYVYAEHSGEKGWVSEDLLMREEEVRKYRRKLRAQRRQARKQIQYIKTLREQGYTTLLTRQTFRKGSVDGVSVGLGVRNISQTKTVKYLRITWKLFNSVGEPTTGQNSESSTVETKIVGPIKPGEAGYTEFENAWYSSVGTCAEVRGIVVEHIDGSTTTYIDDLGKITQKAEKVRLIGDCSYEAQQERKN
ncbi:hypothetical protein [Salinibacter ruber]|uniref:hypothetical protein n=1 Tax=Salinibacter ruber TaxID=146919 RepID=UPI0021687AD1|nr:hypothetical protein [Salinibacter ruber]MCS4054105.1 hypothetical protein [Salinibacter ruber]